MRVACSSLILTLVLSPAFAQSTPVTTDVASTAPPLGGGAPGPGRWVDGEQKIGPLDGNFVGQIEDFDLFGTSLAGIGDHDGDGILDMAVGMWHDDDAVPSVNTTQSGSVFIMFMNADGTVRDYQKLSATEGGVTGIGVDDHFGTCIVSLGDHDGDGVGDIAVGAWHDDDGGAGITSQRGAVYILFLNVDGTVKQQQKISALAGGLVGPINHRDHFGSSLAFLGDLDGDGTGDLLVGARGDHDESDTGQLFVLLLNSNGTVRAERRIAPGVGGFTGVLNPGDFFGESVEVLGDLDGNGVVDLAVGAPGDDSGGLDRGAVWILFLRAGGEVSSQMKIDSATGPLSGWLADGDRFGSALGATGDLDEDGFTDLFVGAELADAGGPDTGAVFALSLRSDGSLRDVSEISALQGGFKGSLADGDQFGHAIAPLGDLNGDGVGDLVVSAWTDDDFGGPIGDSGAVWVLFMRPLKGMRSR